MVALLIHYRGGLSKVEASRLMRISSYRSDFFQFQRPLLNKFTLAPQGGYFQSSHCPPEPLDTMQSWYQPRRGQLYILASRLIPWQSVILAASVSLFTGFLQCSVHLLVRGEILQKAFVDFRAGTKTKWSNDDIFFWDIALELGRQNARLFKVAVALFLVYCVKQKMKSFEKLKEKVFRMQRDIELTAFMISGFLCGDDENRQNARYSIHRWLTVANFFNCASASESLGKKCSKDLVQVHLLTDDEAHLIETAVAASEFHREFDRVRLVNEFFAQSGDGQAVLLPDVQDVPDVQLRRDRCSVARDLCLWWIQVRMQAAVKEKLMDKDKLKKILGAVWKSRESMDAMISDADRRPILLWAIMMQLMIDFYICSVPFQAVDELLGASFHLWLLWGPMWYTFSVAFFYDCVLQIGLRLWSPFGNDFDDLQLDPILVLCERTTFQNMRHNVQEQLPPRLRELWQQVKDIPDEKDKGDKDKSDKGDKSEKGEKGEKGEKSEKDKKDQGKEEKEQKGEKDTADKKHVEKVQGEKESSAEERIATEQKQSDKEMGEIGRAHV
eukprot:TRINITY_DN21402_c0_g1_i1.p1 TRINITY_DN21402_c0_g1~~TRINITY_DN21402_c0_g1_i1.p1  ORF type:complete len:630 (+),score=122.45 TRINITY_DN21402_c0_g1_i1:227-1891(+)